MRARARASAVHQVEGMCLGELVEALTIVVQQSAGSRAAVFDLKS